jgi:serine/threonine protein kinase
MAQATGTCAHNPPSAPAGLRPPVIHRDIKPENVVLEGGKFGGRVFLVDFGGVQGSVATGEAFGSTIVGTYGYMAPEQFTGQVRQGPGRGPPRSQQQCAATRCNSVHVQAPGARSHLGSDLLRPPRHARVCCRPAPRRTCFPSAPHCCSLSAASPRAPSPHSACASRSSACVPCTAWCAVCTCVSVPLHGRFCLHNP